MLDKSKKVYYIRKSFVRLEELRQRKWSADEKNFSKKFEIWLDKSWVQCYIKQPSITGEVIETVKLMNLKKSSKKI